MDHLALISTHAIKRLKPLLLRHDGKGYGSIAQTVGTSYSLTLVSILEDSDDKHRFCIPVAVPWAKQSVSCKSSTRSSESSLILHSYRFLWKKLSATIAEGLRHLSALLTYMCRVPIDWDTLQ